MAMRKLLLAVIVLMVGTLVLAGCGGGGGPIGQSHTFAVDPGYWLGSSFALASPRPGVPGAYVGPAGKWQFGLVQDGRPDLQGEAIVTTKSGEIVQRFGESWDLPEGDYHIIAYDHTNGGKAECWVYVTGKSEPKYGMRMVIWGNVALWHVSSTSCITVPTDFEVFTTEEVGKASPQGGIDAQVTVTVGSDGKGAVVPRTGKVWIFSVPGQYTATARKDGKEIATMTFPVLDGWG
jgi:hypothetical protein